MLHEAGFHRVEQVAVSQVYRIEGDIPLATARRIAAEILTDRVSQEYSFGSPTRGRKEGRTVEVWYKRGVTDPVAETTARAISDAGVAAGIRVATGTRYLFSGSVSTAEADAAAGTLANPLIQEWNVT